LFKPMLQSMACSLLQHIIFGVIVTYIFLCFRTGDIVNALCI